MTLDSSPHTDVRAAFDDAARYFPTPLQQFQFFDKYSRFDYAQGRRETWVETVDRAVGFLHELSASRLDSEVYERIRRSILEMRVMPSMRLLAMAGPAARRSHITLYNCSYQPVDSLDSFVEALIISMSGCGVGFSVEHQYVSKLPLIKKQTGFCSLFTVEDSADGWAAALRAGLETWFEGDDVYFDLSLLRAAGSPLRTKGGRASGPAPLRHLLAFVRDRILARQGSFLTPLDAHDIMCEVGNAAVSGGMRRTAEISLFDFDDQAMLHCKDGDFDLNNSQRWNANNSAVWPVGGITQTQFTEQFMTMVNSGRGEPGIFSRDAAKRMRPARREDAEFGTNPCVTGDTWVFTESGPRQVSDLVGVPHTTFVDGRKHETTPLGFFETGVKPVLRLQTKQGYSLRLTAHHKVLTESETWVDAGSLQSGDRIKIHSHEGVSWKGEGTHDQGWLLGVLVGDGTFTPDTARLGFWGNQRHTMSEQALAVLRCSVENVEPPHALDEPTRHRSSIVPKGLTNLAADFGIYRGKKTITDLVEQGSSDFYRGFLMGLFDTDGTVIGTKEKGITVRLAQSDTQLLHAAQRMLLRLGIASIVYEERRLAGQRLMPDGKGGSQLYECRASHELVVSKRNMVVFADRIGFSKPDKADRLTSKLQGYQHGPYQESFVVTVASVLPDGVDMVYDCEVPGANAFDANGLYVHNCGEILLRPNQFCNLSAAVARADDTEETLREKVTLATIIGTIQSMATNFPGLRSIWKENCEDERLLGVDITGQMDSQVAQDGDVKERLRHLAQEINQQYAHELSINASAAITCVKPSGNSSQLLNCSSGLHTRWSPYYIRNVRVSTHSPLFKVLRDAGVPMDAENGQTPETATTWVIHFPMKSPDGAVTRHDVTAIEQSDFWLQNKLRWTEHNPSCTISYKPDEVRGLMDWVWSHRDVVGGMAFLPSFDANYAQMPYEEITREEYERLAHAFPAVDFSRVSAFEEEDLTTAAQELACSSGACDVDFTLV